MSHIVIQLGPSNQGGFQQQNQSGFQQQNQGGFQQQQNQGGFQQQNQGGFQQQNQGGFQQQNQGGFQQQQHQNQGFQQQQPQNQGYQQPMHQPGFQQPPPMHQQPMVQPGYQQPPPMQQPQPVYQQTSPGYPPQQQYPPQPTPYQQPPPQQPPVIQQAAPAEVKGKKGFDRLENRDGIFIKQKFEFAEMMTGCEQENTYYVYPLSKDGEKKGKKLFKCKEKSSCCARQCMSGECRPFQLKINLEDDSEELDAEPFLLIDRPCKCTCYCCNRPEITVTYVEDGKSEYLGRITDPWNCADITLEVFNKDNNLVWKVVGNCCQCGMHCKGPFDCCQVIDFEIKIPSGDTVAGVQKKSPGCVAASVSDADNFALHYPANATKQDKALLMCAVLFLDFRYFEEPPQKNKNIRGPIGDE